MTRTIHHTPAAVEQASGVGLTLSGGLSWAICMAIGDAVAADGNRISPRIQAAYIGATRDRERWAITLSSGRIDVLYEPEHVRITSVVRPRGGA